MQIDPHSAEMQATGSGGSPQCSESPANVIEPAEATPRRIILLGASNLTIGLPLIVHALRSACGGPLQIYAVHGHGRSFGQWSRVLFRELPGISHCGVWEDVQRTPFAGGRTDALMTDIGNDLLYGVSVETIRDWLTTCLARLHDLGARVVLTGLPLESVMRLGPRRYTLIRSVMFPGPGPNWEQIQRDARRLHDIVVELAAETDSPLIVPSGDWYGFDPIHVRRASRLAAWGEILAAMEIAPAALRRVSPVWGMMEVWRRAPAVRKLFGATRRAPQPALRWESESGLWIY